MTNNTPLTANEPHTNHDPVYKRWEQPAPLAANDSINLTSGTTSTTPVYISTSLSPPWSMMAASVDVAGIPQHNTPSSNTLL